MNKALLKAKLLLGLKIAGISLGVIAALIAIGAVILLVVLMKDEANGENPFQ